MTPQPAGRERSDEVLMDLARIDDADAFAELYQRHAALALRIAWGVCRDTGQAEEAVQEGFLSVWLSRAAYRDGIGGFRPWAMTIVRNRAIDSVRRAASRPSLQATEGRPQAAAKSGPTPTQDAIAAEEERDAMLASLRQLPDAQAEVIVLAFYGELSYSEIAVHLELPPGTVKGRMRLGLEKLRGEMTDSF